VYSSRHTRGNGRPGRRPAAGRVAARGYGSAGIQTQESTILYTDEWQSYRGSHPAHATVCHSVYEWARDEDGDGRREVHSNTCEGAGAALRTYLRVFRGVHQRYLHLYVATYEAMVNAQRVTPQLIRRMCLRKLPTHTGYT
jgi:transposase-like protein